MSTERPGRRRRPGKHEHQPVPVGAAIQDLIRHLGLAKTMYEYSAVTAWESTVGEQIARVARAERVENGILFVAVTTAPWRAELSMKRRQIIEKLNAAVGKDIVKDIRFR